MTAFRVVGNRRSTPSLGRYVGFHAARQWGLRERRCDWLGEPCGGWRAAVVKHGLSCGRLVVREWGIPFHHASVGALLLDSVMVYLACVLVARRWIIIPPRARLRDECNPISQLDPSWSNVELYGLDQVGVKSRIAGTSEGFRPPLTSLGAVLSLQRKHPHRPTKSKS